MSLSNSPHLVWVYPGRLEKVLSAATQLETTQEMRNLGWQVTLIDGSGGGIKKVRGIELLGIERKDLYFLGVVLFHFNVIRHLMKMEVPADVVMFHQISALWLFPLRLWRMFSKYNRPILILDTRSLHMSPKEGENLRGRLRRVYFSLMNKLANYIADGQTAITQRMAEAVKIPPRQLLGLWPSAVTLEPFERVGEARKWPEQDQAIKIIYLGYLSSERNLMTLAKAVSLANQKGMNFVLSLIGHGPQAAELQEYAQRSGGGIEVLAPVDHADVPGLLTAYHVGAIPFPDELIFQVSSPIKLFEYMASGMVVLTTRVVNVLDVVGEAPFTIWINSSDIEGILEGLDRLWQKRDLFPSLGEAAVEASAQFTWRQAARQLKTALELGLAKA